MFSENSKAMLHLQEQQKPKVGTLREMNVSALPARKESKMPSPLKFQSQRTKVIFLMDIHTLIIG